MELDPDWVPSLKLGYGSSRLTNSSRFNRFQSRLRRKRVEVERHEIVEVDNEQEIVDTLRDDAQQGSLDDQLQLDPSSNDNLEDTSESYIKLSSYIWVF